MGTTKIEILKTATALTGGIATGKSTVAGMFRGLGASIIDTDLIARDIVKPGMPALEKIHDTFGSRFLLPDGNLNREMMRSEIINNPEGRESLNKITHPAIMDRVNRTLEEFISKDEAPVIIDVPLLFETGWDSFFTNVILVYIPAALQLERLMKRDGIDRKTAETTLTAQMPIEKKKGKSGFVVDNSKSLENTKKQVKDIYRLLGPGH